VPTLPVAVTNILNNPASIVGVIRAISILAVSFGLKGLSGDQLTAMDGAIIGVITLLSLIFTGITVHTTTGNSQIDTATLQDAAASHADSGAIAPPPDRGASCG
jgi:hypothetical protein